MNLRERICDAFCAGFVVREVKMGFAVRSPFRWLTGDYLAFYGRRKGGQIRFEDDGLTVAELQGAGADILTGTRFEALQSMLQDCGVRYDDSAVLFHTDYAPEEQAGALVLSFLEFMTRLQEFQLTTRAKVENTFKDDLIAALVERFGAEQVVLDEAPVQRLSYYKVDIVVHHSSGRTAAIFPGTSEPKALDAVLFSKELQLKRVANVVPFLIFEDLARPNVSAPTRSKATNSDLQLADWAGDKMEVIDKVEKYVTQAA